MENEEKKEELLILSEEEMHEIISIFQNLFPMTRDLFINHEIKSKKIHVDVCGLVGKHNTVLFTMGMSCHHYGNKKYEAFTIVPNDWFKIDPGAKCFFEKSQSEIYSGALSATFDFLMQFAREENADILLEDNMALVHAKGKEESELDCIVSNNRVITLDDNSELHLLFLKLIPSLSTKPEYLDELQREFINSLISYMVEK